jgi:hypothetical protein
MPDEKFKTFKRLYVTVDKAIHEIDAHFTAGGSDEKIVEQAITNIDAMISMLPMEFPAKSAQSPGNRILLVNLANPEDEPQEIIEKGQGYTLYKTPENTHTLYEVTILTVVENWKFVIWNLVVNRTQDMRIRNKYIPMMLAQASHCMKRFPHGSYWQQWEKDMYVLYANQIGWFAYEKEQDIEKLEAGLAEVEKAFPLSNWRDLKYIKDTKVRLLLKLNRPAEAYPIVREALKKDPAYVDFQDLKNDAAYLSWLEGDIARDKKAAEEKQKAYEAFLQMVKAEQAKITNQFVNPQHPLVIQHADALNLIRHRMLSFQLRKLYKEDWITKKGEPDEDGYALEKWSVEKVAQFEKETGLRLPDELKVYLMEIGEGGESYFCYGGVDISWLAENSKELERVLKPFPITEDKIHDIGHWWGIKAWVYPDDTDWIDEGKLKETDDMEKLFGLPAKAGMSDGVFPLGDSSSQDPLVLIMNGVFEGEVWVDRLQYGAEAGGCFAPATAQKLKFLAFIAESILAHEQRYTNASDQGSWM